MREGIGSSPSCPLYVCHTSGGRYPGARRAVVQSCPDVELWASHSSVSLRPLDQGRLLISTAFNREILCLWDVQVYSRALLTSSRDVYSLIVGSINFLNNIILTPYFTQNRSNTGKKRTKTGRNRTTQDWAWSLRIRTESSGHIKAPSHKACSCLRRNDRSSR